MHDEFQIALDILVDSDDSELLAWALCVVDELGVELTIRSGGLTFRHWVRFGAG